MYLDWIDLAMDKTSIELAERWVFTFRGFFFLTSCHRRGSLPKSHAKYRAPAMCNSRSRGLMAYRSIRGIEYYRTQRSSATSSSQQATSSGGGDGGDDETNLLAQGIESLKVESEGRVLMILQ